MSTFNLFVQLAAATGRPVVFFDFETAGLDAPPVEVALVAFGSEPTPSDTLAAVKENLGRPVIALGPPSTIGDLATFAMASRLNPGQPIRPGAMAIHGIKDADVRECPRFDDPEFVGLMHAIDGMDPIWCGHNVKRFDLPLAERCGILPHRPGRLVLDTIRWAQGAATRWPFPPCFDPTIGSSDPERGRVVPVCEMGLDGVRGDLGTLHLALCGWRFEGAHGAMSDVIANVRVASRLFDLWMAQMFADMQRAAEGGTLDVQNALRLLLDACDLPPEGYTGHDKWLKLVRWTDAAGRECQDHEVQKGKHRGRMLTELSVSDMRWIRDLPDVDDGTRAAIDRWLSVATTTETFAGKASTPSPIGAEVSTAAPVQRKRRSS